MVLQSHREKAFLAGVTEIDPRVVVDIAILNGLVGDTGVRGQSERVITDRAGGGGLRLIISFTIIDASGQAGSLSVQVEPINTSSTRDDDSYDIMSAAIVERL